MITASLLGLQVVIVQESSASSSKPNTLEVCPADVETLTALMLRDLPSYANRVSQRSRRVGITTYNTPVYVIVAGRPEFAPLSLGPGQYSPTDPAAVPEAPNQVFFTTLERQYSSGKAFELQQFHWLFLTYTQFGWQVAMMYSQIGSYPDGSPPTPPRESSNGIIGQGVRTWLRDCRAGALRSRPNKL
ncbi:MAG: hypothetical protein KME08_14650 [Aphanothece sp. CMT-3BRIN-NPC111]|nr:hypothetical protein [Aphanothece sp. CMT-3BRIN-NPC111]